MDDDILALRMAALETQREEVSLNLEEWGLARSAVAAYEAANPTELSRALAEDLHEAGLDEDTARAVAAAGVLCGILGDRIQRLGVDAWHAATTQGAAEA